MKKITLVLVLFLTFSYNATAKNNQFSFANLTQDINIGIVGTVIPGNVSTNDSVASGTTYGNPVEVGTNPNTNLPVVNPNGTYNFATNLPGVYTFLIGVCVPSAPFPCPSEILVITVINPLSITNPPVANNDISITPINTPVVINVKANDGEVNVGGMISNPTINIAPANGSVTINPSGTITYTPMTNFTGSDSFSYSICESPSGLCEIATVGITILPIPAPNTILACDDYVATVGITPAIGNVLNNDNNSDDSTPTTVIAQNRTISGQGTFVLSLNGTYVFTPVVGFAGTVSIPYIVCDGSVPVACSFATLYIVVINNLLIKNEFKFDKLKYYPNPAKNSLSIINQSIINSVEVKSILGQKIMSQSVNDLQTELDFSGLTNGVYFVKVFSEGQSKTIRIVKE
jgi:Bacterial Ig domain/Secretion system C-terminal sorting domain